MKRLWILGLIPAALAVTGLWGSAAAQAPGALSYDTAQPIHVESDSLEVREEGRTAIFTGHVKAVQGDLKLSASEIRVYYRHPQGAEEGNADGLIARIDANGAVTISTRDETASGEWAIYDVDQKILTLGGAVHIQRGENTVAGQRLVLDLASGQTRIESGSGDGRVRGTFTPSTTSSPGATSAGGENAAE
jgi:lipopolysaccharide export system protein LptA